ncbi:ribulose-phosphate 3-epimerase [Leptospira sp. 2 VSF19]|uniref:Ribulose-phosphate 3-epimerase n=1 Tax=Leptospira soteropolitanensis TaxID=2950025 RepID=A0AAW5VK08_9LEPT|nr:ribulose-phosphate 3-epimerase [Leptospira soteropolitanensis]MCW7492223.1 ribulose-phosphate 3-epimerase [Leptospira soteropolitanensis]MCW7499805.1 ribulose-phosphate 3-epimerase [Leptospira soteropolitanensis]MCW7522056.1 ribulose-phosphate 3-epimerase [Leptospira soteropolitanensis]MCW7525910.1 ribulose-phosphate 3-epimerase [Leptospira soteropolitanensis]MCW7529976.1 ribulose-phosphate 3-epimerase [Leptospira soteropolitanensis]
MKISASILAAKLTGLSQELPTYKKENIDLIHIDVMDGNFVPQISFGEAFTKEVKSHTEIPLDVHLMVSNPELHVPKYFDLNPYCITFHIETTNFSVRLAEEIRKAGIKVGVSLNPQTPPESISQILPYLDLVLLMTVDPGFYGQSFVKSGFDKIAAVRKLTKPYNIELEVDGGVNESNMEELAKLGVDITVVGSGLYKTGDPNAQGKKLKDLAASVRTRS